MKHEMIKLTTVKKRMEHFWVVVEEFAIANFFYAISSLDSKESQKQKQVVASRDNIYVFWILLTSWCIFSTTAVKNIKYIENLLSL